MLSYRYPACPTSPKHSVYALAFSIAARTTLTRGIWRGV